MATGLDSPGLTFRQDYFGDPAGWAALVRLLQDIFGIDIDPLQQLGGPDASSMPFGWFDAEGELAANLSAFALPFVLNGRIVHAAGLQSGAVRPPWRGRGLYRDLTVTALDWCERQGFEAVILYTDKPSLYEPYAEIPSLAAILGGFDIASATVEVLFRPDKLGWTGAPQPFEGGTTLMLRGLGDDAPHFPAMLSPMADF
ncbi:UNVERIFIED_ORG: GNAT superfamily N-acetyltransferase [Rhizobium esperanzae]